MLASSMTFKKKKTYFAGILIQALGKMKITTRDGGKKNS